MTAVSGGEALRDDPNNAAEETRRTEAEAGSKARRAPSAREGRLKYANKYACSAG